MSKPRLEELEALLGYIFNNKDYLQQALTHSSHHSASSNERLEFLGDSFLNCLVAEYLYVTFPQASEGELTQWRAALVNGEVLASLAEQLQINKFMRLSYGENKSGGRLRQRLLEDAMEAIIGALYLDSDFATCKKHVMQWFGSRMQEKQLRSTSKNAKSRLQEYAQSKQWDCPSYKLVDKTGPEHELVFNVSCAIKGIDILVTGKGATRRSAEQIAAKNYLKQVGVLL